MSGEAVLRYFDCRSRGQALRFALVDSGTPFEDERISLDLAAFRARADDAGFAGPFGALPVLHWRGRTLAQTLAVAGFLAAELGRGGDDARREQLEMVTHAAHLDMQVHYRELFWRAADLPDERLLAGARVLVDHLATKTRQLDALLAADLGGGPFFGGAEPAMADYFVFESLDRALAVFGADYASRLEPCKAMHHLHQSLAARPRVAAFVAGGGVPFQVTASPTEPALRERLAASRRL